MTQLLGGEVPLVLSRGFSLVATTNHAEVWSKALGCRRAAARALGIASHAPVEGIAGRERHRGTVPPRWLSQLMADFRG